MTGFNIVILLIIFTLFWSAQWYYSKNLFIKLITVTYLFLIASGTYLSLETYKGWPTSGIVPGMMIGSMTIEPDDTQSGSIYVWVRPDKTDISFIRRIITFCPSTTDTPRAFVIPYNKKSANDFANANQKMKDGYLVHVSASGTPNDSNSDATNSKNGKGNTGTNDDQQEYDVPHLDLISPDTIIKKD